MWSIDRRNRRFAFSGAVLASLYASAVLGADGPARAGLGTLPPGELSSFEVSDVRSEICRTQFFPADAMPVAMPPGYRLAKLSERTVAPAVADLLRIRPDLGDYAKGTFCFIDAGVHKVDGKSLYPGRGSKTAFLWVDMVATEGAQADARQLGARRRAQLFWFYDDEGLDKNLARKVIPDAMFGRISIVKAGQGWIASLRTDHGEVVANVTPTTERAPLVHPLPAFETVPLTSSARAHFLVVTYAGHHEQKAVGDWRANGSDRWVRIFTDGQAGGKDATFVQDGFSVHIGLYKFAPDAAALARKN